MPVAPTILLAGVPRSGTTLACHLLNRLPDAVALHEPMDVGGFAGLRAQRGEAAVLDVIAAFAEAQRATLVADGTALSKQVDGALPDNPVDEAPDAAGLRGARTTLGRVHFSNLRASEFHLVMKHNAAFTALLPGLAARFPVFALVRNPLSALGAWSTVRFPVREGRAPMAERLDTALAARLDALATPLERQIELLGWFFGQFLRHLPRSRVLRYEDLVASGGAALGAFVPGAATLAEPLASRNRNALYDPGALRATGERLLRSEGAYWDVYRRAEVEALLA
jgi:hypothetical protein